MEAHWDRRFSPPPMKEQQNAVEDLCVYAPEQIDAEVVSDN
jgi:hypothetical protein